jgi:hypothetical protein
MEGRELLYKTTYYVYDEAGNIKSSSVTETDCTTCWRNPDNTEEAASKRSAADCGDAIDWAVLITAVVTAVTAVVVLIRTLTI